MQENFLLL